MATKIKSAPSFGGITETYWPGDEEVDLEASDLEAWCREGGRTGLVIGDEEKCAVIRWRPLTPREQNIIDAASRAGAGLGVFDLYFALGFVSARNVHGVRIQSESSKGVTMLSEESIRSFEQVQADLPIASAYDEFSSKRMGADKYLEFTANQLCVEPSDGVIDDYREGLSLPVSGVTITQAVGVHIALAGFR